LLDADLKYAFWQNHAIVDAAIGTFSEYGTTNPTRTGSYASSASLDLRDYYRTYMLRLEKYGIKIHHDDVAAAWDRIVKKNYVHQDRAVLHGRLVGELLRIEAQTEKDFECSSTNIRLVRRVRDF